MAAKKLHIVAKPPVRTKSLTVMEPQPAWRPLALALLGSLLAHAALVLQLGEPLPLPTSPPELPPRILLNLTEAPTSPVVKPDPPVVKPAPLVVESPPPPPPPPTVAKALKPKPPPVKPEPRQRSRPKKRVDPQPKTPVVVSPTPTPKPTLTPSQSRPSPTSKPTPSQSRPTPPPNERVVAAPPLILNPRYRRPPTPPIYPSRAIRLAQQGTALVQARISATGDVVEARVHRSSGYPLLDKAALTAVRQWAFVPAIQNGAPIEAWVRVPVNFVLKSS